jgi:pimeloyl-ACP methyl ester carboxylesterase
MSRLTSSGPSSPARTRSDSSRITGQPRSRVGQFSWKTYGYAVLMFCALAALGTLAVLARPLLAIDTVTRARLLFAGFHGEYTSVDGHRIHYLEGGGGKPILLIHGLGGRATDWANLMPQLARGGYHVYAIDMLGYGDSDKPMDADYSIAQETVIVRGFLDRLHLEGIDLAGWSMGGWVAIRLALEDPRRISRLVLCDAAGVTFAPDYDARDFLPQTPAQLQRLYDRLTPHPAPLPGFLARDMLRRVARTQWVIARSAESMFAGHDLVDERLRELRMPVLIIWGREDHLIPVSAALVMHARIPQSTLELYDACGHLAPGQCAQRIGPRMLDFLRGGNDPAPGATLEVPKG